MLLTPLRRGVKCLVVLSLLFSAFGCFAQERKMTTCVENNGTPCPAWLHKLIGQYPPLPDRHEAEAIRYARFFTFNKDSKAALHPDKTSWAIFAAAHTAGLVALVVDRKVTHGAREHGDEYIAIGGVGAMDFLLFKTISPSLSVEAPAYEVYHYAKDATR